MKSIQVPFVETTNFDKESTVFFSRIPSHSIQEVAWEEFPYLPFVKFKIAYSTDAVLLEYNVVEKDVLTRYKNINDPVYKDSCVEFFISFDHKHYYNFEFNSIGTALVGYGTSDKESRLRLPEELIKKIEVIPVARQENSEGNNEWTLQLKIPFELFLQDTIDSLKGTKAWANFYKCGDDLPEPHFVSWSRICAEEPNFHLPEYFGEIEFV